MARVRLIWVWLITLIIAVMAGCGGDDSQTEPGDAAKDTRTDTVTSDVRTDTPSSDVRTDTPTSDTVSDGNPPPDVRQDMPGTMDMQGMDTPRPPDADAGGPDIRPDVPADQPIPPSDVTDSPNPPPPDVTDAPIPPTDTPADVFRCTADNQCPNNNPHCNTTTGACVSASSIAVTPIYPSIALGTKQQFQST